MSLQVEVAEALCSALYRMPFVEFLGEDDITLTVPETERAHALWFHLGEKPKDMRVTVVRPEKREEVQVKMEWRNYFADGRNPLKGEQTLRISTYAATQAMLQPATEQAVLKVLEVFRQVLSEEGVAGKISDLLETSEQEEYDDAE